LISIICRSCTKIGWFCNTASHCCGSGSGIWCFFTPWIWDQGWSNGRIRDKQTKFVNSLYTKIGRIQDPVLFYPPDQGSGSGMEQWSDPDPGSAIKHPGSATLLLPVLCISNYLTKIVMVTSFLIEKSGRFCFFKTSRSVKVVVCNARYGTGT
jgi:hypothetical protein